MDAVNLQAHAAVGFSLAAGNALPAFEIRENHNRVADLEAVSRFVDRNDFSGQFMPQDAGVGDERMPASIGMKVGSADAHPQQSHEGFPGLWRRGIHFLDVELARLFANDGFHGFLLFDEMGKMKGGCFLFWIISNLIEKKNRFLSAKVVFPVSSANQRFLQRKGGPMPGQKNIRLAKKGGGLSVHKAGSAVFSQTIPFPPRLFAERKQVGNGKI
jgi:hypothetical protein